MISFTVALLATLALAFVRIGANSFEGAYYFACSGKWSNALRCLAYGLVCVFFLSLIISPLLPSFDLIEVQDNNVVSSKRQI